jgi:hypothetical protein
VTPRRDHTLLLGLATHFPGSKLRHGAAPVLDLAIDGARVEVGLVTEPELELVVSTIPVDGFSLELTPRPRQMSLTPLLRTAARRTVLDTAQQALTASDFDVTSNDAALAQVWLDVPARGTLPLALHLVVDEAPDLPLAVSAGPPIAVGDRFVKLRVGRDLDLGDVARAVRAGWALASRPLRLARAWTQLAAQLGGRTTAGCWDLGDQFAAVFERGASTVEIDNVRRLRDEAPEAARLRTRVRARQLALTHDFTAHRVVPPDAVDPRAVGDYHLRAAEAPSVARRLHALAPLLEAAVPDEVFARGGEITLTWDGMVMVPGQLAAAIDLVARLAADRDAAVGPYR